MRTAFPLFLRRLCSSPALRASFQAVELTSTAGTEVLAGAWFDSSGTEMATLSSETPSHFRIRLWPQLRVISARAENQQIVLTCESAEHRHPVPGVRDRWLLEPLRPSAARGARGGGARAAGDPRALTLRLPSRWAPLTLPPAADS